jgi:hypothetical protein
VAARALLACAFAARFDMAGLGDCAVSLGSKVGSGVEAESLCADETN